MTRHNLELISEARTLREFGWTQQRIADFLKVPRTTVLRWLRNNGQSPHNKLDNPPLNVHFGTPVMSTSITLYQCKYEEAGDQIPPESIDLIVTDPPYLVSSKDINRKGRSNLQRDFGDWDKTSQTNYEKLVAIWAKLMGTHLKPGGSLYLFMNLTLSHIWSRCLQQSGLTSCGELIWHRTNPAPQIRKTRWCHAFNLILFFAKGQPKTFNWLSQNAMQNVITGGICGGDERSYHPTQKPRYLLWKLIRVSSLPGDIILDPFAGSGSTAFASFIFKRNSILVEPEPQYSGLIQSTAKKEFNYDVILRGNNANLGR
jgi:DNA modification methylase